MTNRPAKKLEGLSHAKALVKLVETAAKQPAKKGYCTKTNPKFPLTNQTMCKNGTVAGAAHNVAWKIVIKFCDTVDNQYQIRFGVDFGVGNVVKVDGKIVQYTKKKHVVAW